MLRQNTCPVNEGVAAEWAARAEQLADSVWSLYVNRTDVWGGYNPKTLPDGTTTTEPTTRPSRARRGKVALSKGILVQHFQATTTRHVVGCHTTSPANTSRFGSLEIDRHGAGGNSPEVNQRAALGWHGELTSQGFHPLLTDSDGRGGYHLDILLREPISTARFHYFLKHLRMTYARYGLTAPPEIFPKQKELTQRNPFGNWLRLPGRHPKRDHWSKVWDGRAWLAGGAAADYLLTFQGDPPSLVPEDSEIRYQIACYRAKLPNRGEGQGRDDVAYNYLAFLARDMALPDADALAYASEWDALNTPPKGRQRLEQILADVHQYGQRAYGSGLNGKAGGHAEATPDPAAPGVTRPPTLDATGYGIIFADFKQRYAPVFRRGTTLYSSALGREVRLGEACAGAPIALIEKLAGATDAPRDRKGNRDRAALPYFFNQWCRSAWADLLGGLPEEEVTAEISESAQDEFRGKVTAALLTLVSMGRRVQDAKEGQEGRRPETEIERRSLLDWCWQWAKPGRWESVRSYMLWTRREPTAGFAHVLKIALRVELFNQIGRADLAKLTQNKFDRLAAQYGVGEPRENAKVNGTRCTILTTEFVEGLLARPGDLDERTIP